MSVPIKNILTTMAIAGEIEIELYINHEWYPLEWDKHNKAFRLYIDKDTNGAFTLWKPYELSRRKMRRKDGKDHEG